MEIANSLVEDCNICATDAAEEVQYDPSKVLVGDVSRFFRKNETTNKYEINLALNDSAYGTRDVWMETDWSIASHFMADATRGASIAKVLTMMHDLWSTSHRRLLQIEEARTNFNLISEELIRQANDRGWCEEYDQIVETLNESMVGGFRLTERTKEYEVEFDININGHSVYSGTVEITAKSQEEANEFFSDSPSDYVDLEEVVIDAIRYGSIDLDVELL